jgi:hypothetical protein
MSHILTQELLENPARDEQNIKGIQEEAETARVDPEDIKPLVEQDIHEGKQGVLDPNLLNSLACLNGLASDLAICQDVRKQHENLLPKEEENERRLRETLRALPPKIGGVPVFSPTPQQRTKILFARGVSVVLLLAGYATFVNFLHEQMGWTWLGSTTLPFVGVLGVGFAVKAVFDQLSKHSHKAWRSIFFATSVLVFILACLFFYLIAGEYSDAQKITPIGGRGAQDAGADISDHGSKMRFFYGMLLEILAAGLAWAFSDEIVHEATNMNGEIDNPDVKKHEVLIAQSQAQQKYHSSRIGLAKGLVATINTGIQRLRNDATRIYTKIYAELSQK